MKIRSDVVKCYKDVHIWGGIIAGLLLFVAFYAGAITLFETPLERRATPPSQLVAPPPLQRARELVQAVLAAHPQATTKIGLAIPRSRPYPRAVTGE